MEKVREEEIFTQRKKNILESQFHDFLLINEE
jgi:hypothetical protein